MRDATVVEMFDKFRALAQSKKIDPFEIDDTTAVGLEIL
jgi:hypothetical protein